MEKSSTKNKINLVNYIKTLALTEAQLEDMLFHNIKIIKEAYDSDEDIDNFLGCKNSENLAIALDTVGVFLAYKKLSKKKIKQILKNIEQDDATWKEIYENV